MGKALVVGIDYYEGRVNQLTGCVRDARSVGALLGKHQDGSRNFDVDLLLGADRDHPVTKDQVWDGLEELFAGRETDLALFYFAGHGHLSSTGGYLRASNSTSKRDGLSLHEILSLANQSEVRNRIVILDCCHAGSAGARATAAETAELKDGLTILAAATARQSALEDEDEGGVFTTLLVDALEGAAANLVGEVTPASVYAHIDQAFGHWEQRPVFKSNVTKFVSLRRVKPPVSEDDLRRIAKLFKEGPKADFPLDPSFEPESEAPIPKNTKTFAWLQRLNRVGVVVPVGVKHMYFAAMESRSCRLTPLGRHYWRLANTGRI